ncbi:MAG: HEPN domain-containing protein [Deltaproteobacteria bacterium]|nr:HEPN domain-containing protein [Deltaproteobacteria bacterium]
MKDETKTWLRYGDENLQSAHVLLKSKLFNPCLQNVQQAVEKWLKALLTESSLQAKKTHSISELRNSCVRKGASIDLSDDECDFLDSIYLPSKYPLGGVLPDFEPDEDICQKSILLAERIRSSVTKCLG